MKPFCFSIGHSNYCLAHFLDLLQYHGITMVADVRTVPYSQFVPHFNREELAGSLSRAGIKYVYSGRELGGRELGTDRLDDAVQGLEFQAGIDYLQKFIAAGETVALVCAKKDPLNCHRFFLVAFALEGRGVEVRHILESGNAVAGKFLEEKLVETYHDGLFQLSLFEEGESRGDAVRRAYSCRFRDAAGLGR